MAPILLIGTLDTKGAEIDYARSLIRERGHPVVVMDCGVMGDSQYPADIPSREVARAGASSIEALRAAADRGAALEVMTRGVCARLEALVREDGVQGVLGLGGSGGTVIATAAMRALPVGVPKVMVSTIASGDVRPYVGIKDITMMYSVVDIAGLNGISRRILSNAVGALCGMAEQPVPNVGDRPLIAATMFGVTTPCVDRVRQTLEDAGFEVIVFHATGSGGRAMEALIESGFIRAVADITTTEWCDEVVGGVLSAGPDRLGAAGRRALPQVVSCGALDMVNFWAPETVPAEFRGRNLYRHNANVTLMRTSAEETARIGRRIGRKLAQATGPVTLLLPGRGVSAIDAEGQPFHDPQANAALFAALRETVGPFVDVVELDMHINDPAFAESIVNHLLSYMTEPGDRH